MASETPPREPEAEFTPRPSPPESARLILDLLGRAGLAAAIVLALLWLAFFQFDRLWRAAPIRNEKRDTPNAAQTKAPPSEVPNAAPRNPAQFKK